MTMVNLVTMTAKVTVFSDHIVISYSVFGPDPKQPLCRDLIWLTRSLLEQEILTRGAVTVGSLYHDEGVIFGDALIEAHRLETKLAIYPRIIVQEGVLDAGQWLRNARWSHSSSSDEDLMSSQRDFDGVLFLNPFTFGFWSVDFLSSSSTFLRTVREKILKLHSDADKKRKAEHIVKFGWLANHFNEAIKEAKCYQDELRNGQIISNAPLPQREEDFGDIEEIDWKQWIMLPLTEASEATRGTVSV